MTSRSLHSFGRRAASHPNALARALLEAAERKQTNVVVSLDVTTTAELLDLADKLGPQIVVLKTHIDVVEDFSQHTIDGLVQLAQKHGFFIFEDRKLVDIGSTVQKQWHGGALKISSWADIVNATVLPGPGIIEALAATAASIKEQRGLLILATMTSKGSLATGNYTQLSVECARRFPEFVIGFVTTHSLAEIDPAAALDGEDFLIFTTGVNISSTGDALGQQYVTPASAVAKGADFVIAGRGIYAAADPAAAAATYRQQGWAAYLERIKQGEQNNV